MIEYYLRELARFEPTRQFIARDPEFALRVLTCNRTPFQRRLIDSVGVLSRRHRVLCVAFSDYELADLIRAVPESPHDLYRQAVAASMLEDRRRALAELARRGVLSVDAGPSGLTVAVINKYLELKAAAKV